MVILRVVADANVAEGILHDGLQDVRRLHADLLGEAALVGTARIHAELVNDHLKQVELLVAQITEQLLIRLVGGVERGISRWSYRPAQALIDLV